jgi:hypothetical protein
MALDDSVNPLLGFRKVHEHFLATHALSKHHVYFMAYPYVTSRNYELFILDWDAITAQCGQDPACVIRHVVAAFL